MADDRGVRKLTLDDIAPRCEFGVNLPTEELEVTSPNAIFLDIGCGGGRYRQIVKKKNGIWLGMEKYSGGPALFRGDVQYLPVRNSSVDFVVMDAVLEHVPDVTKAFAEVSRVLKTNGVFIGYVAWMECFHEISYCHLSFKALEYFSNANGMRLEKLDGGGRFGIDFHLAVLLYPLPAHWMRPILAFAIRNLIWMKSRFVYIGLRAIRKLSVAEAIRRAELYFKIECLRQSNGFSFKIKKIEPI